MKILFLAIILFFNYANSLFAELINLNQPEDFTPINRIIKINIEPFDKLQNTYVFINDGSPVKITERNQKIEYLQIKKKEYLKIDVVAPAASGYKSAIFYFAPDTIEIQIKLKRKLDDRTISYFDNLAKTIMLIYDYSKNRDALTRIKIDNNLKLIFDIDTIEYLTKIMKNIDYKDYLKLIEKINVLLLNEIEDEYSKLLAQLFINLIPKLSDSIDNLAMLHKLSKFPRTSKIDELVKANAQSVLLNMISAAPLFKNIYEWFIYYPKY
ncbi:MAG TPA: hypothetical protein PLJ38_00530 [bacterium]|nr:hypothetical protein [bacterium]